MPRDGLSFSGYLQPPSVPPDPIDEDWRGPPGEPGPGADLHSPGPIGDVTSSTGAFTALVTAALTATTGPVALGSSAFPVTLGDGANAKLTLTPGATSTNSFLFTTNGIGFRFGANTGNSLLFTPGATPSSTYTLALSGANGLFQITSGGNINLTAQGSAPQVLVGSGLGAFFAGRQKLTFAGTGAGGAYTGADTALYITSSFTGSTFQRVGPIAPLAQYIAINGDNAAIGAGNHASGIALNQNFGGASMTGGRTGIDINCNLTTTSGNAGIGNDPFYVSLYAGLAISANDGGTGKYDPRGGCFAFNPQMSFENGATYLGGAVVEVNLAAKTGSLPTSKVGIQLVKPLDDRVDSFHGGVGFAVSDQIGAGATTANVGWRWVFAVAGRTSQWPVQPTGTIFGVRLSQNYTTVPQNAARGVDLLNADFSEFAFITKGASITGDGKLRVGTAYLRPVSTGAELDVAGSVATACAVTGGTSGSGFNTGGGSTQTATCANNGVYVITTVAAGAVTGVTMYRAPYVDGAPPSNPVALTMDKGFDGTGLEVNLTWSTRTDLAIQPSGGKLGVFGATPVVKQTAVPVTAAGVHAALVAYGLIS